MHALRHLSRPAHTRSFHSPFVALNASSRLVTPSQPAAAPTYEKQHDASPEPHLSSSGTHTYVVSEPDPSNTPFQVPSGAYPAAASYRATAPIAEGPTSTGASHPYNPGAVLHKEVGAGQNAGVRNTAVPGETGRMAGGIGPIDVPNTKPGKF